MRIRIERDAGWREHRMSQADCTVCHFLHVPNRMLPIEDQTLLGFTMLEYKEDCDGSMAEHSLFEHL